MAASAFAPPGQRREVTRGANCSPILSSQQLRKVGRRDLRLAALPGASPAPRQAGSAPKSTLFSTRAKKRFALGGGLPPPPPRGSSHCEPARQPAPEAAHPLQSVSPRPWGRGAPELLGDPELPPPPAGSWHRCACGTPSPPPLASLAHGRPHPEKGSGSPLPPPPGRIAPPSQASRSFGRSPARLAELPQPPANTK